MDASKGVKGNELMDEMREEEESEEESTDEMRNYVFSIFTLILHKSEKNYKRFAEQKLFFAKLLVSE